jgi:pumilio family protein 6
VFFEIALNSFYNVFLQICAEEFIPANFEARLHLIEHPCGHFVLKKLLKSDRILVEQQMTNVTLTKVLCETIPPKQMCEWTACNKGCFVLVKLGLSAELSGKTL